MTQKEFEELPMMLRPWQAAEVLGLDRESLATLREAREKENAPIARQLPGGSEWKYFKCEIAKLVRVGR
jgi:hypothetical protein